MGDTLLVCMACTRDDGVAVFVQSRVLTTGTVESRGAVCTTEENVRVDLTVEGALSCAADSDVDSAAAGLGCGMMRLSASG